MTADDLERALVEIIATEWADCKPTASATVSYAKETMLDLLRTAANLGRAVGREEGSRCTCEALVKQIRRTGRTLESSCAVHEWRLIDAAIAVGREEERAEVVAFLRHGDGRVGWGYMIDDSLEEASDVIASGAHRKAKEGRDE